MFLVWYGIVHLRYEEKVDELSKLRDQKKVELCKLRRSTPEDLWDKDLEEFLVELDLFEHQN